MSSLTSDKDIQRAARKLIIDEATLSDRLADPDKLVEFAAYLVRTGRPIKTVARALGITKDKIAEEKERYDAETRAMGGPTIRHLMEDPPS
jgi:hypothetical protein